ncbi:hypothetical protein IL992_40315 [Microbispora sp. NEAU-D428]|nr:hypothetical protein [Microbispora sitophila]
MFGADAPGVGTPGADPFERGPFESFPRETVDFDPDPFARNPFEPPPGRSAGGDPFARDPFETGGAGRPGESDPFARNPFDTGGFDTGGFGQGAAGQGTAGLGAQSDPFARSPFESGPFDRAAFDKTPFEATNFDSGPFDSSPFDTNPFSRGHVGEAPVDTPWPGHLPPPGGGSWPGTSQDGGAGWPGRTGRGAFEGDDNTGPLPVVRSSPLESGEEFLPIFAAVESDWFKKVDVPADKSDSDGESGADAKTTWSSPADAGWQAARAASEPALGGVTSSGLPKRVPKANLVPGSADPGAAPAALAPSQPILSPDRARGRLASLQQGVRQGRAVARGELSEDEGYPTAKGDGE